MKILSSRTEKLIKTAPETVFSSRCINRDECLCVAVFTPSESDLPWCGMLCFSLLSVSHLLDRINCMSPAAPAVAVLLGKMYSVLLCDFAVSASHSCFSPPPPSDLN